MISSLTADLHSFTPKSHSCWPSTFFYSVRKPVNFPFQEKPLPLVTPPCWGSPAGWWRTSRTRCLGRWPSALCRRTRCAPGSPGDGPRHRGPLAAAATVAESRNATPLHLWWTARTQVSLHRHHDAKTSPRDIRNFSIMIFCTRCGSLNAAVCITKIFHNYFCNYRI